MDGKTGLFGSLTGRRFSVVREETKRTLAALVYRAATRVLIIYNNNITLDIIERSN